MQKIILSVLVLLSFTIQANELPTFTDIAEAVSHGKQLTFMMNVKKCTSEKSLGKVVGSVTPNAVMLIDNNRITASDRHFTLLDNPDTLANPGFEYSKYNITADGKVSVKITLMNATNYEQLSSFQMSCALGEGFKVFG